MSNNSRADRNAKKLKKALKDVGIDATLGQARNALAKAGGFKSFHAALGVANNQTQPNDFFIVCDQSNPVDPSHMFLDLGEHTMFAKDCIMRARLSQRRDSSLEGLGLKLIEPDEEFPKETFTHLLWMDLRVVPLAAPFIPDYGHEIWDTIEHNYDTKRIANHIGAFIHDTANHGLYITTMAPITQEQLRREHLMARIAEAATFHHAELRRIFENFTHHPYPDF